MYHNASSHAEVTSVALVDLQSKVLSLSRDIHEMYEFISDNLRVLGEEWRDEKFAEFDENFRMTRVQVEEIAERYDKWAKGPLQKVINDVVTYEKAKAGL